MACQIFLNAKNARMDEMKSSIRKFLALTKMTRDEFADLCGVSKSQVDKWLSTVPIPRARTISGTPQYSRQSEPFLSIQYGAHSEALPSPSGVMTAEGFFNYGPHSISSIAQQD